MPWDKDGPSEEGPVEKLSTTKKTKTQVVSEGIEMGTPELNVMVKDIGHVTINFSTVLMYQVNAN